ncbi:MAG: hypothetical protein GWN30_30635, partial [Gammaproteobacteria bacterium]|nr:hypothetical protein [Gammaproteobacteria bacterium]
MDALDELASRQLIMMDEENYWFKHDLIRAVVEDNLNFGRKKLLHRRAGEVLVDLKSENPAQIAFHFIKAQETKKATRYLLQAGDQARKLFGHQEAVKHYQQALNYQKKHENFEGAARTLMRLGLAYQIGYDHSKAQDAYQESFNYRQQKLRTPIRNKSINPRPLRLSIHSYRASGQLLLKNYQDLDPSSLNSSQILMKQLFSSFINIGSNRLIQPEVARDWMISDDGRSYTFHLRKDATWSDGEPVTAYDFELAWNRVNDISKGFIPFKRLPTLTGARVRASNQHTLEIKLREPVEHLINLFGHEKLSPIPSHILKKYDDAWTQPENFITNGPFQLEEWAPGQCITLERSPSYFGNFKGNLSRVKIFQKKLSPADQLAAYQDGEIDILALQPETYQARFQHEEEYHKIDNATTLFLGFGKQETLFHDP